MAKSKGRDPTSIYWRLWYADPTAALIIEPPTALLPSHSLDPRAALRERIDPEQADLLFKICDLVKELRLDW